MTNLDRLCRSINYTFKKPAYLKQALTHCSVGSKNNERLEFLGDSILSMVIANALYEKFPNESEGKLSRLRAFLVKGETLACIAQEIELGNYLLLGQGELKSGGFRRASILADALEAIFAAVFLDGGVDESQRVILSLFKERLNDDVLQKNIKDAKTQLQEHLQSIKLKLPVYTLTKVTGDEHNQEFHINCFIPDIQLSADGKGDNRRKAEQSAATKLLKLIKK